jgi:hypothetical protein
VKASALDVGAESPLLLGVSPPGVGEVFPELPAEFVTLSAPPEFPGFPEELGDESPAGASPLAELGEPVESLVLEDWSPGFPVSSPLDDGTYSGLETSLSDDSEHPQKTQAAHRDAART